MTATFLPPAPAPRATHQRAALWAVISLAMLSACASPAPGQSPQALSASQLNLPATPIAEIATLWWRDLGDARLQALIAQALQTQPDLQQAQARVRRMQALVGMRRAASLPQAALSGDFTRQRFSEHGLFQGTRLAGHAWSNDTLQVGAGWTPDLWGEHAAALAAAVGQTRAAQAEAALAGQMLANRVVRGSIALARWLAQERASQEALRVQTEQQTLNQQRHASGLDSGLEQAQGDITLAERQAQLHALQEQISLTRHQLAVLCGLPAQALSDYAPTLASLQLPSLPAQLGADLLGRRPDVVAARWRAEAAEQQIKVARTQFYPSVNLSMFAGYNALGLEHLLQAGNRQYGVVPALHLPLFEGGRLQAQLGTREAERDAAVAQYNQTVLEALREAADAIARNTSADIQISDQAQALDGARRAHALALQREQAGLGNRLALLSAQANLIAREQASTDALARQLDARVQLLQALGGGWSDPDASPATATPTPTATR